MGEIRARKVAVRALLRSGAEPVSTQAGSSPNSGQVLNRTVEFLLTRNPLPALLTNVC